MKRALIAIPLISIAIGLFLFLWHAGMGPKPDPGSEAPPGPPSTPGASPSVPAPVVPSSPVPPAPPVPATGAVRLYIHGRGQALGRVRIVLTSEQPEVRSSGESLPDGTLVVTGLRPGTWMIAARHPEFVPGQAEVQIAANRTVEAVLELKQGGRVFGVVTDAEGRPVAAAEVNMLHGQSKQFLHPDLVAVTDAAGRYRIEGIPLLELGLHVRSTRHRPWMKLGLVFAAPGDAHEVNAVLEAGTQISGRVVDESGAPIEGAHVTAGNEFASIVKTDREGRFAVFGLGDEAANLSASARGFGTAYVRGVKPDTSGLEIRLARAGAVAGRIQADPMPSAFAVILSRYDEYFRREIRVQPRTFSPAGSGDFELQEVAPGTYTVLVEAAGYEALERPVVAVASGQKTSNILIKLRKKE